MSNHQTGPPGKEVGPDATNAGTNHQVSRDTITDAAHDSRSCRAQPLSERGRVVALSGRHPATAPIPPVGQLPDAPTVFVGTLLWSASADAAAVLELVADDDLESPALSEVVAIIRRLAAAGRPCDAQMVLDELGRGGRVHRSVALALMDATASGAQPQAARYYAAVVVAAALRRKLESAGHALIEAAQTAAEANLAPIVTRAAGACLDCAARLAELRGES